MKLQQNKLAAGLLFALATGLILWAALSPTANDDVHYAAQFGPRALDSTRQGAAMLIVFAIPTGLAALNRLIGAFFDK